MALGIVSSHCRYLTCCVLAQKTLAVMAKVNDLIKQAVTKYEPQPL